MKPNAKEIAVFGMLGAMMYASKVVMEVFPNIHLLGVFVIAMTVVYRAKALYPIYLYALLLGLFNGFSTWWVPHLYLWTLLWGAAMLLPKQMPKWLAPFVYMALCAVHGFLYGTLYAPFQALAFGLDWHGMVAWIISGLPFDMIHGVSNFFCGALILPLVTVFRRLK